jgi:hypothetical protein
LALLKRKRKKAAEAAAETAEAQGAQESAVDGTGPEGGEPPVLRAPIVEQPPAAQPPAAQPAAEPPAAEQAPPGPVNETLPAALEPELRRIIEAIRESRQLTQRSEEEGREALKFALDKSLQLVNSFELLTVTVAGMVSALRVELDAATTALQQATDPVSQLSREVDARLAAPEALPPVESPPVLDDASTPGSGDGGPEDVQGMNGDAPEIRTEQRGRFVRRFFSRR